MWLGVFSIAIAMHFRVFHRLYSSTATLADERDNIAVSQRVLGKYQIQTPLGITLQATLPNMMWSFQLPKANISQHYPNNVGWCCANMLCSFARGLTQLIYRFNTLHVGSLLKVSECAVGAVSLRKCHVSISLRETSLWRFSENPPPPTRNVTFIYRYLATSNKRPYWVNIHPWPSITSVGVRGRKQWFYLWPYYSQWNSINLMNGSL